MERQGMGRKGARREGLRESGAAARLHLPGDWRQGPARRLGAILLAGLGLVGGLAGCGQGGHPEGRARSIETLSGAPVLRRYDPRLVDLGERVFREHCARCHGERAQGAPGWRRRLPDGSFPPPPLDGSGHAWHHPRDWLAARIREGAGRMPAWGGTLSEEEIQAVVEWFQSLWPDPVYAAWYQNQERARGRP